MADKPSVLVLGATGLFGELLAQRIASLGRFSLIAAGRGRKTLHALKQQLQCDIAIVDRDDPIAVAQVLAVHKPFAVIDCAGPFQYYGDDPYRFARQVLEAGSHYIDIADGATFVAGFNELDTLAKAQALVAITGASSIPALSAAAADVLCESMQRVEAIETALVPGNRARRTLSVMKAILGQVGQPFVITRYGKCETVYGWGETRTINLTQSTLKPVSNRLASLVHTPDIELFPQRYGAATVTSAAGLEIKTFHRALQLCGWLVRVRLIPTLGPFAKTLRWIASGFVRIGTDIGGMQVAVTGVTDEGAVVRRSWEIIADNGRGPEIPTLPVSVLLDQLLTGELQPGARPALGEVTLSDLEPYFKAIEAVTAVDEQVQYPIFKTVLGSVFDSLPEPVQSLHNTVGQTIYTGTALSKGPTGLSGRLTAWLVRFPKAGDSVPVKVTITADAKNETWQREFDGVSFKSHLSIDAEGYVQERFGIMTARLGLTLHDGLLNFPVLKARMFGCVPWPKFLLPTSIAHETVDDQGRFVFDVLIKTPFGARIAHYQGWLVRQP